MTAEDRGLRHLARLYGVQPAYFDVQGRLRRSPQAAVMEVLRALGADLDAGVRAAVERRRSELRRPLPPVLIAWDGELPALFLGRHGSASRRDFRLRLEDGEEQEWRASDGGRVQWPWKLPPGYHDLVMESEGRLHRARIIAAPRRCGPAAGDGPARPWGTFLPLYALHSAHSWDGGDLTDLEALTQWTAAQGGAYVATLPLLATFLDATAGEPSPYAPVSRLFWNEIFLDVERTPELAACPEAQALLASGAMRRRMEAWRASTEVDYAGVARAKHRLLRWLAAVFFSGGGERTTDFRRFLQAAPAAVRYARFRAVAERRREPWPAWPARLRNAEPDPTDYDEAAFRMHLYAQYQMHRQLKDVAASAGAGGARLYLDLPLGVHPDGFDVWANRSLFADSVSVGAPPDPFISRGQNWGFPPPRPTTLRATGYEYTIACVRAHLRYAGALRLDHVMALHRLFWVPAGAEPADGVYVRYSPEDVYAVLALESQRAGAVIVGEDLGTVPDEVRAAMTRHGVRRMYVAQFEFSMDPARALPTPPTECVASLNTHDMPPFAAFWQGLDIDDRQRLGWLDEAGANGERGWRQAQRQAIVAFLRAAGLLREDAGEAAVLEAVLRCLAAGPAEVLLVNLEDLWRETRPQNVPGTWRERPNWRRKAVLSLEEMKSDSAVLRGLAAIEDERRSGVRERV